MRLEDLPDDQDRNAVAEFALSFYGYEPFGSFFGAADAAMSTNRETLVDLRNELFMAFRGSNHRGDDLFLDTYRELRPLFAEKLKAS